MCDEQTSHLDSKNTKIVFDMFKHQALEIKQTIFALTLDLDFTKSGDRTTEFEDRRVIRHNKEINE